MDMHILNVNCQMHHDMLFVLYLLFQQFHRIPMNIYTFLMAKDKCETFFPKLRPNGHERGASNRCTKKISTQKLRNVSMDKESKFRLTCHDVLMQPNSAHILDSAKQQPVRQKQDIRRECVLKASGHMSKVKNYSVVKELGKGGFAEVVQVANEEGERFAMKQYVLESSVECYRNEVVVGEHFFEKGKLKSEFSERRGGTNLIGFVQKIKSLKKGYIIQELGGQNLSKMLSEIHGVFHKGERVYEVRFSKFYFELARSGLDQMLQQIAVGIQLLNSEGFIHCDLKPENILVSGTTCKIIDFGSAFRLSHGLPKITITPEYMPPQLLLALDTDNSNARLDKIDVWSFGCIVLEIVTGIPLWFRYKCKISIGGRENLQLGYFALTNREYHKIIKRQRQLCQSLKKIAFVLPEFEPYRKILLKTLTFEEANRSSIDEIIKMLENLK